jgi:hypothetical protein
VTSSPKMLRPTTHQKNAAFTAASSGSFQSMSALSQVLSSLPPGGDRPERALWLQQEGPQDHAVTFHFIHSFHFHFHFLSFSFLKLGFSGFFSE